jgi:hypothetical protein
VRERAVADATTPAATHAAAALPVKVAGDDLSNPSCCYQCFERVHPPPPPPPLGTRPDASLAYGGRRPVVQEYEHELRRFWCRPVCRTVLSRGNLHLLSTT